VNDDNEIFAAMNAEAEQSAAAIKDMAKMTGAFYRGLVEDGLTGSEAMMLTGQFLTGIVRGNKSEDDQ